MFWLALAFLGPISWAASTHIDKYLVEKYFKDSNTAVLMVFTAIVGVIAMPLIWLFQPSVVTLPFNESAIVALSGAMYMGAMLFYLRAMQSGEASVVAPLFQFSTVFTLVLAWIFLREALSWTQLGGVGLILAGALAVSTRGCAFLSQFNLRLVVLMAISTLILAA